MYNDFGIIMAMSCPTFLKLVKIEEMVYQVELHAIYIVTSDSKEIPVTIVGKTLLVKDNALLCRIQRYISQVL